MTVSKAIQDALRNLPSVDDVLLAIKIDTYNLPHVIIKDTTQKTIDNLRKEILRGNIPKDILKIINNTIVKKINSIINLSIKPIINGTGIVLHTGFGRAPISEEIIKKTTKILSSYCSLEFDIENGIRGERLQYSKVLLNSLLKSEDSLVVNNCAAALFITLNTIAFNKEVIISRGQQVEIGGSFRIPDIIKKSGCNMIEVGTTNRTHIMDYKNVINKKTGAILIVHPSNYKVVGFTKDVDLPDLVGIAKKRDIPIILDLGSGMLLKNKTNSISNDPIISKYFELGINLITFSADKLLGGPQAGIISGDKDFINKIHKNPIYRSLRCNKFILTILEQILSEYKTEEDIFKNNLALLLLNQNREQLLVKGKKILDKIDQIYLKKYKIKLIESNVEVGSGSLPTEKKESIAMQFSNTSISASKFSEKFRLSNPPIIGYINNNHFHIDLKAILEQDFEKIATIINKIDK